MARVKNRGCLKIMDHKRKWIVFAVVPFLLCSQLWAAAGEDWGRRLEEIENRIQRMAPDPACRDDANGLIVIKLALVSLKEGSGGGIGACLVDERSGAVVAKGRNRQYKPYFRSDLHAEMDLLTRYEDWLRKKAGAGSKVDPRDCNHLVLVSSVEPCPMCLTRMINAGIKKMVYVVPDETGGMVSRMDSLPPFWRERAHGCDYRQAACSPGIRQIARELFTFSVRSRALEEKTEGK